MIIVVTFPRDITQSEIIAGIGEGAVIVLGALLQFDIHDPGHGLAVLGIKTAGDHFQFFDGIHIHIQVVGIAGERVFHRHSVHNEHALVHTTATDVNFIIDGGNARLIAENIINAIHHFVLKIIGSNADAGRGLFHIQQGALPFHHNLLAQRQSCFFQNNVKIFHDSGNDLHTSLQDDLIAHHGKLNIVNTG